MKYFDNIPKERIIKEIEILAKKMPKAKLRINISQGLLTHTDGDRVGISKSKNCYSNLPIQNLSPDDLMIILRYLENMNVCRDIAIKNSRYGEIYDLKRKKWNKIPCNKDEVRGMIKEYLKTKKGKAFVDFREKSPVEYRKACIYLKKRLKEIGNQYGKNPDGCYDFNEKRFIIIIDKYQENEYALNLIHLITEMVAKFKIPCYILSMKDFAMKGIESGARLCYI